MSDIPRGYRHPWSRARVKRAVILVAVAGILLQFAVPAAMVIRAISDLDLGSVRSLDPEMGALWKGSLWLVESETGILDLRSRSASLVRWTGKETDYLEPMARFDVVGPRLLPARDRLWVVARDTVGWLGGRGLEIQRVAPPSPVTSSPFLLRGRPGIVAETPAGPALFTYEEGSWVMGALLDLEAQGKRVDTADVILADDGDGGDPWLIVRDDQRLLVGRGLPTAQFAGTYGPLEVAVEGPEVFGQWSVASIEGEPLLVTVRHTSRKPEIVGYRRMHGQWTRHFSIDVGLPGTVGAHLDRDDPGRVLVAYQGYPGSLTIWEIVDGTVLSRYQPAGSPFAGSEMSGWQGLDLAISLLVPVLAVLLLSPILVRHRTATCPFAGDNPPLDGEYASLARRGLAKVVDALFFLVPVGLAGIPLLGSYLDVERTMGESLLDLGTYLGVAFGWAVVCAAVFSYQEARFGRTLGKRLAGVRVVSTTGGRVSLGRALLRNLLLIIDGTLGSLVGIALVALTPRRQRLGDLAAKTLVVRG